MSNSARAKAEEWIMWHSTAPFRDDIEELLDAYATEQTAALRAEIERLRAGIAEHRCSGWPPHCAEKLSSLLAATEGRQETMTLTETDAKKFLDNVRTVGLSGHVVIPKTYQPPAAPKGQP